MKFEVFCDPGYFDMWCLRTTVTKDISETLHFATEQQARYALSVVQRWLESEREECAKAVEDQPDCAQYYNHVPGLIRSRGQE